MNSWNAEWRTTAAVGEEPGLHTDFYQPLGTGADWFTGASLLAQQFNINIFDEGSNDITEQVRIQRLGATVYAGREFGSWGRGWIGVTRGGGDRSISIGDPSTPDQNFDIGEATFTLEADRLDSLYFSRHGHSALALYRYSDKGLGATENFEQAVFSGRIARSFGANTFIAYGDYKSTISGVAPPERLFRVGGLFNLSGFEYNQLSGQNFAQVAVAYRRDFVNLGPLRLSAAMTHCSAAACSWARIPRLAPSTSDGVTPRRAMEPFTCRWAPYGQTRFYSSRVTARISERSLA
jgi:NTE family protein